LEANFVPSTQQICRGDVLYLGDDQTYIQKDVKRIDKNPPTPLAGTASVLRWKQYVIFEKIGKEKYRSRSRQT